MVCLTSQKIDTKLVSEALKVLGKENFALIIHGSSFPSKEGEDTGFGSFNSSAGHDLIDYVHGIFNALQLGPAGKTKSSDSSPYTGTIFSGNPLFIDLKQLTEKKWDNILSQETFEKVVAGNPNQNQGRTAYSYITKAQNDALKEAWGNFKDIHGGLLGSPLKKEFEKFKKENSQWLDNDSLYEALSIENNNDFWYTWENETDKNLMNPKSDEEKIRSRVLILVLIVTIVFILTLLINLVVKKPEENKETNEVYNVLQTVPSIDKPVIYLYPEEENEISVKLGNADKLTSVYPEYNNGWTVIAYPDGTLVDEKTGREYYSLYYESENTKEYDGLKDGFVVKNEDIVKFLEEKLSILGLNDKEAEEFIIYWLPRLQQNEYVYIRFQSMEEIEENMPLEIIPKPDTLIRIIMEWKGLNEYIQVQEQELTQVVRNGFTVVEWGGTEIK